MSSKTMTVLNQPQVRKSVEEHDPRDCPMRDIQSEDMAMARAISNSYGIQDDCDLESAAMSGLLEAAELFDGRGAWAGFAVQRIRWRVLDAIRKRNPIPVDPVELYDDNHPAEPLDNHELQELLANLDPDLVDDLLYGLDRRKNSHKEALEYLRDNLIGELDTSVEATDYLVSKEKP